MQTNIKPISEHAGGLEKLAGAYAESYRAVSAKYKEPDEMAAYTDEYFLNRIRRFAKEDMCWVMSRDGDPIGFARFNDIPEYYINPPHKDWDSQTLDGVQYNLVRKLRFNSAAPRLDDKTAILNQIYLTPQFQKKGLGGELIARSLALISRRYKHLIVEYNLNNGFADDAFYHGKLGMVKIGDTQDFDGIVRDENGALKLFVSPVGIRWQQISSLLYRLSR